jgi:hypothetical protein
MAMKWKMLSLANRRSLLKTQVSQNPNSQCNSLEKWVIILLCIMKDILWSFFFLFWQSSLYYSLFLSSPSFFCLFSTTEKEYEHFLHITTYKYNVIFALVNNSHGLQNSFPCATMLLSTSPPRAYAHSSSSHTRHIRPSINTPWKTYCLCAPYLTVSDNFQFVITLWYYLHSPFLLET